MIYIEDNDRFSSRLVPQDEKGIDDFETLYNYFSIEDESKKHTAKVRAGIEQPYERFVQRDGRFLYGLKNKIHTFCVNNDIGIQDNTFVETSEYTGEDIDEVLKKIHLHFKPYDYQIEGLKTAIKNPRKVLLSATGCLDPDEEFTIYVED